MAVYNIIPNQFTADDVRDTLNASGGNVGNNWMDYFGKAANVNPWSKRKPVPSTYMFCQDFDSAKPNYVANWWRGTSQKCGLDVPTYSNIDEIISKHANWSSDNMLGWVHNWDMGIGYKRLGDFAGYKAGAQPPVLSMNVPNETSPGNKVINCVFHLNYDSESVALSDVGNFNDCYFGAVVANSSYRVPVTAVDTIGNGDPNVSININSIVAGTYTVYPFISGIKIAQGDPERINNYWTLPLIPAQTLKISSSTTSAGVRIKSYVENERIYYTITLVNNTDITITMKAPNTMMLRYTTSKVDDPIKGGESAEEMGQFTIGPHSEHLWAEGRFNDVQWYDVGGKEKSYIIIVKANNGALIVRGTVLMRTGGIE